MDFYINEFNRVIWNSTDTTAFLTGGNFKEIDRLLLGENIEPTVSRPPC